MSSGNPGMIRSNFSSQSTGSGGNNPSGSISSSGSTMEAQKKSVNNTIILCKVGCETTQDIVQRTLEVFAMLKSMQLPNGSPQTTMNSPTVLRTRLQEQLLFIQKQIKQLRAVYVAVNEDCAGLEFTHIEKTSGSSMSYNDTFPQSLIPYKDDTESQRLQDIKNKRDIPRHLLEESRELKEQLYLKARYMKEIIDQMRKIIWEVNTMLAMSNT